MSPDYFKFQLKPSQEKAFIALQQFAGNESGKVFILKGYAGTGKTSLMKGFILWLQEQKIRFYLLASTGRAAKVLSDITDSKATTVHSQIYKFDDLDDDLEAMSMKEELRESDVRGQLRLMFELKSPDAESGSIYIVDEASMIADVPDKSASFARFGSGELLSDLFAYDANGKFIFVGDPGQLPPVGQDISPALSESYLVKKYGYEVRTCELNEISRQGKANGIIDSSMKFRRLKETNSNNKFASFPFKGYTDITIHRSLISLLNAYIGKIKDYGFGHATLICQMNRYCSDLNAAIRAALGKEPGKPECGDILMVTQNNYLTGLVNGDFVEVLRTGKKEYRCGLAFLQVEVKELGSGESQSVLLIENILNSRITNINNNQNKDLLIDYYRRMRDVGISQKEEAFREGMLNDPYLNALKAVYGYAITFHKSQGGEWQEVFLYLDNKIHGIPRPGLYQWMYTAVTRAKDTLHVADDWFIN